MWCSGAYGPRVSTLMHPVGPEPAGVYWRRRLLLLLAVVALVLLVVALTGRGGRADTVAGDAAGAAPEAAGPAPAAAQEEDVAAGAAPPGEDAPACAPEQLDVSVAADAASYAPAAAPRFVVTATNTGDADCAADLGPSAFELVLESGDDRVWSSADCQQETGERLLTLSPGDSEEQSVSWQRVRSADGCPEGLPEPRPGSYEVTAEVGGVRSAPAAFTLG